MKNLLMTVSVMVLSFHLLQAQQPDAKAMFVVVDTKPDKNPTKEQKKLNRALKKLDGSEIPGITKSRFFENFGDVPGVHWERQDYFDVATFTKDGQAMKAYFDTESQLVGTVNQETVNEIPYKAKLHIQKEYPDYTLGDVILYTDNQEQESNIYLFGSEMESANNYFVELTNGNKRIVLKVSPEGEVYFFKELKSSQ